MPRSSVGAPVTATGSPNVIAIRYDWRDNAFLAVHNLDSKPHRIRLAAGKLVNLLSDDHSEGDEQGVHRLAIEGYGYRWYRVGGLDHILKRKRA